MCASYEMDFFRSDGRVALYLHQNHISDASALAFARRHLCEYAGVAIWRDEDLVEVFRTNEAAPVGATVLALPLRQARACIPA